MHFDKTLDTEVGRLNFYFNKIYIATLERFHVSVIEKNKVISVLMENMGGTWKILNIQTYPVWIRDLEASFNAEINAYLLEI